MPRQHLAPEIGIAVVRLLERLGHAVEFPTRADLLRADAPQHRYRREALQLARRFVGVFADAEVVVAPSASCVGTVRELYPGPRVGDPAFEREVAALAPRVLELSELLVGRLGLEDVGASFPHRVTYHPTCHSLRMLRVGDAPLRLLRAVRGLDLVELPEASECCGFGGTFAVKNADTSAAMLADKVRCVARYPRRGLRRGRQLLPHPHRRRPLAGCGSGVRPMHLAEILAAEA